MNRSLFFLVLLLSVFVQRGHSQSIRINEYYDEDKKIIEKTYYINNPSEKLLQGEYIAYYANQKIKIKGFFDNNKETGDWSYYYESGKLKTQGQWNKGKREGLWKNFYESGLLKNEGYFQNGEKNGAWNFYYENGTKKSFGNYIDGKREKIWNYFYEDSKLKAQAYYRSDAGLYKEFYNSGALKMEGVNAYGKSEGVWKYYYETGELEAEGTFKKGYKDGLWKFFHKNKNLASKGYYDKGVATGTWEEYYEDGGLASKGLKNKGKKEGHWELYYESGKLKGEQQFENGQGTIVNYYENGAIMSEGKASEGKQSSVWKYYDPKGNLEGKASFINGEGYYVGLYPNGKIRMRGLIKDNKRVGKWELYNQDESLAGYYHPIYEDEPPAYITSSTITQENRYKKPNYKFRKGRSRYFKPVVNEYKGVILSSNPLFALVGQFPLALEYYVQERIGYELQYTFKNDPFMKDDSKIALNEVFSRGASLELKQKFYSPDTQFGMLYFGHLFQISNDSWFKKINTNGEEMRPKLSTRRYEYGIIVGNRWMKDSGNSSPTIDIHFGFGLGYRAVDLNQAFVNERNVFPDQNTDPLSMRVIFNLNIGFSAPKRNAF